MANHRTPDGVTRRYTAIDSPVRTTHTVPPSLLAPPAWTYGPAAPAIPAPRTGGPTALPRVAGVPADVTAPARPAPAPAPAPPADPVTEVVAEPADDAARRSGPDDIAARATTTLIPSSPGARRAAGPVFVDGSGRRARRFKGIAAAAAALAAGYVGVVVTGALAGSTGPATSAVPVASLAPVLPPTPEIEPTPVIAKPAETTPKPARPTTTTKKKPTVTATPKKIAPKAVTPPTPAPVAPAPVVPAPAAPVTPPAGGNTPPKNEPKTEPKTEPQQATPADQKAAPPALTT